MILVLAGKTSSGKNAVVNELVEKHGYRQIVTTTTRPMRKGEKQGITYHFITEEDFKQKIENEYFVEYKAYDTEFGIWYYGTSFKDLEKADDKSVIILTPQGYRDVKDKLPEKNITCIYLYANNATIKKRLVKRGDDIKEANRRLEKDIEDFKGFENEADRIIYNNDGENLDNVVKKILDTVKKEN